MDNNTSGYLGLTNMTSLTADELDITNLEVDTATINVELQTNNIQPLTNNSNIDIGTVGNTGIINLNQDTEVDNLQVNVELKTENIQPINGVNDIIIGTIGNTGQILHYQNTAIYDSLGVSTTYPVSTYGCQIVGNGVSIPAKLKLVNETSGEGCYIELNRGDYDFGADGDRDWRLMNDLNGYFYLQSGQSTVIKDYITAGDDEFHITNILGAFVDNTTLSVGTTDRTRRLNVSNKQDTTQDNYILLQNDNYTNRGNGIQIQNSNSGVLNHNWYLLTRANASDFIFNYNGGTNDRFIFTNAGVLKLTTLTGTTTSTAFNLGESGDSGSISVNRSMTFASGKNINMPSNGVVYTLFVRNNPTTSAIQLYDTTTTGSCSFMTSSTTASLNILNGTTSGAVNIFSNLFVGTNAVNKGIACAYYQSYDPANLVRLFPTSTTGNIRLGEALTTGNLLLHNTAGSGTIQLQADTTLSTGKNLTLSTTSALKTNSIQPIAITDNVNLYTTSTTGNISIGSALTSGHLYLSTASATTGQIYALSLFEANKNIQLVNSTPTLTDTKLSFIRGTSGDANADYRIQNNYAGYFEIIRSISGVDTTCLVLETTMKTNLIAELLGSQTTLATGSIFNCNNIRGVAVGDNITLYDTSTGTFTLGNASNTNKLTFKQPLLMDATAIYCDGITATAPNVPIYIGETSDTSFVEFDRNVFIYVGKIFYSDTQRATSGITANVSLYDNTTTGTITCGAGLTSGDLTLHNSSATTGRIKLQADTQLPSTKTLYLNFIDHNSTTSSTAELYSGLQSGRVKIGKNMTSGFIELHNASATTGQVICNSNMKINTTKNLYCNSVSPETSSESLALGGTILTGNVAILGNQSTGNLYIGSTTGTGKTIFNNSTIQSAGNIVNLFNNNTTTAINIATGLTTASLTLGGAQTSGSINLYNTSATGRVNINGKVQFLTSSGDGCWINTNSGANIFTVGRLVGNYISSTLYANANTQNFSVWDSSALNGGGTEASAILQNGDTTIFINPGDAGGFSLFYLDEDSMTTTTNYAWTGWKMSATTGAITTSSDRRVKKDILPVVKENLLEILSKIQFVNYKRKPLKENIEYKDGKLRDKYKKTYLGVIAQDVKQAGLNEVVERENDDAYFMVNYQDLGMYFSMGVQELIKENIELKGRLNKLEQFIASKFSDW